MSDPQKNAADTPTPVPAYVPEDLIHAWLWCRENGTQWLVTLTAGILLAVGVTMFLRHRDTQALKASEQLLAQQPSVEVLEKTVADYGSTPPGIAAKLKLAKAYYDDKKYSDALAKYDDFIKENSAFPFVDVARVGRGYALMGLNRLDEAIAAFITFREKNPGHYLNQQTILGEAACLAMQGKKDAAKALLQELRAANRETPWETAAKRMEIAIDRYQAQSAHTLLEQANAIAPIPATAPATPAPAKP